MKFHDPDLEKRCQRLRELGLCLPKASSQDEDESARLLFQVVERTDLNDLDFLCIRDLMKFCGEQDGEAFLILVLLFQLRSEGSLCLEINRSLFLSRFSSILDESQVLQWADRCIGWVLEIEQNGHELISRVWLHENLSRPLVMEQIYGLRLLYFQKSFIHEQILWEEVERLSRGFPSEPGGDSYTSLVESLYQPETCLRLSIGGRPLEKDPDQIRALINAWQHPFTVITGGPGTGKTSLLTNLLRGFLRLGVPVGSITLGAPTGRAAQRIMESIHQSCASISTPDELDRSLESIRGETLHRILGAGGRRGGFSHHRENPLLSSILVIDEASMIDIELMCRLLSSLQEGMTRLIVLGDRQQLPSVESGAVLSDLVSFSSRFPKKVNRVNLLKTYRSGGKLLKWSKELVEGRGFEGLKSSYYVSMSEALSGGGDREMRCIPFREFEEYRQDLLLWSKWFLEEKRVNLEGETYLDLVRWIRSKHLSSSLDDREDIQSKIRLALDHLHRFQVLALSRSSPFGVGHINHLISSYLARRIGSYAGNPYLEGSPIMVTMNDHIRGLFNGDIGILLRDRKNRLCAAFQTADRVRIFSLFELRSWEPAFAITVHKSQGSEYENILLILPDQEENPLLVQEIIYTGITRAKNKVFLYARKEILKKALSTRAARSSKEFYAARGKID